MSSASVNRRIDQAIQPRRRRELSAPRLDYWMLLAVAGLVCISLVAIAGATRHDIAGDPGFFVTRQAIYVAIGIAVAVLLMRLDYSVLQDYRRLIWAVLVFLNAIVLLIGSSARGSQRWISLPFFQLQPSELGKVLLIVSVAGFAVEWSRGLGDHRTVLRLLGVAAVPAAIVAMQPDLGTALVYMAVGFAVLVAAGAPSRYLVGVAAAFALLAVLVLTVLPAVGIDVLQPYQVQRLTGFVNPSSDPGNATYQVNQSLIAIGSGQRLGRGAGATQTGLDFLPEHHTDFIFAVIGERWGFVGASLVIALYALLLWRALRLVLLARDGFGSLLCTGIVAMLGFQIFVNIGMTLGIMPITGVPLPLTSYGGSSVLTTLMALGLLQSVHLRAAHPAAAAVRTGLRV